MHAFDYPIYVHIEWIDHMKKSRETRFYEFVSSNLVGNLQ